MMAKTELYGVIPPLATPFHADGSLNLDAVPALVEHVIGGGVHAILALGSQGEAFALSADERAAALDAVLAAVNGRVPVMAGTGAITTQETIRLTQQAERAGADAAAIVTPFYIAPSQEELYAHYADVAAAVSIPILGYSNPVRTGGVRIMPETLGKLAHDIKHFIGVKDSGGDLGETAAILRACPSDFRVLVGSDALIVDALGCGADGAIGLSMNIAPALAVGVYQAYQSGDHTRARELQEKLSALRRGLISVGTYPAPVKAALEMLGIPMGPPRKPIHPVSVSRREELRALLRDAGLEV
jgi:4-hydroxy-tetrahydrodipicolinate synthase